MGRVLKKTYTKMKQCERCKIINNVSAENWKSCIQKFFFTVAISIDLKAMIFLTVTKDKGKARSSLGKKQHLWFN